MVTLDKAENWPPTDTTSEWLAPMPGAVRQRMAVWGVKMLHAAAGTNGISAPGTNSAAGP